MTSFIDRIWDDEIVPTLVDYIRIPNKSPAFDPHWKANGHMAQAMTLYENWTRTKMSSLDGATLEVVELEGRTPLLFIDIPGDAKGTVLLYGHLDKQPEMTGWTEGTGPWVPVIKDNKLFGRGGADDGYAMFASLAAILSLRAEGKSHARCVICIEACEESGSYDLPFYIDHLADRIGTPDLVVCLDSGCGNYDQLWLTTSLRGIAMGNLTVRVLTEGVHSGDASGVVPSSFRLLRQILSRVEDEQTGEIKLDELFVQVPPDRLDQASAAARILGSEIALRMPFAGHTRPMATDPTELVLNRTWRPQLAVTAMAGYPLPQNGGNVLLPYSTAKLSFRLPPTCDAHKATASIKNALEADAPNGAEIEFEAEDGQGGWNAPSLAPWLQASLDRASQASFGKPVAFMGEGGSIPFMGMLGEKFPRTQFVVTGVLGPHSNAHGPNEFLHLPTAKKLTACIAMVLADHAQQKSA